MNRIDEASYQEILSEIKKSPFTARGCRYYDVPICFDTESTSFTTKTGEKGAYCYIWMMAVGDKVVYGRYLKSFVKVCERLSQDLRLSKELRLLIFVNYLGHDFQFFHRYFKWKKVFARKGKDVLFGVTSDNIEFRCSYLLTGLSVDSQGKKVGIPKLADFDYTATRHSKTQLSERELMYCEHDVTIMSKFLREKSKKEGGLGRFELTKTGYTRTFIKKNTIWKSGVSREYRELIKSLTLTTREYELLKGAFGGGFTHANANYARQILYNLESYDINSCYPACLISNKFPMQKVDKIFNNWHEFERINKEYICVMEVKLKGVESRLTGDHFLSSSKCYIYKDGLRSYKIKAELDNGRVVSATELITKLTDIDFMTVQLAYKISDMEILDYQFYTKEYLPKAFILALLEMYNKKTVLKGVKDLKEEYDLYKQMFNGSYGMMCMDIVPESKKYINGEWKDPDLSDVERYINKYNTDAQRVNSYAWGCYTTALGRARVWDLIFARPKQYVYSDTDSGKLLYDEKNRVIIDKLNNINKQKILEMCDYYNIDFNRCQPKGYLMGDFSLEQIITRFKTLGAKRYLTEGYEVSKVNGEYVVGDELITTLTCSGVNKVEGLKWLIHDGVAKSDKRHKVDAFDLFEFGYTFPPEATKKLDHRYIDKEITAVLTDYHGQRQKIYAPSGIHFSPSGYEIDMNWDYQDYIEILQTTCGIYENSLDY